MGQHMRRKKYQQFWLKSIVVSDNLPFCTCSTQPSYPYSLWGELDAARCPPSHCLTPVPQQDRWPEQDSKAPGSRNREMVHLLCPEQDRHALEKNCCGVLPIKNRLGWWEAKPNPLYPSPCLSLLLPWLHFTPSSPAFPSAPPQVVPGSGGCSQCKTAPLISSFSLSLFLCSTVGSQQAAVLQDKPASAWVSSQVPGTLSPSPPPLTLVFTGLFLAYFVFYNSLPTAAQVFLTFIK